MFRYRYDTETNLYYLQSRYYNPEWGRFINADALVGETGELLSHNMFAYCGNNTINRDDQEGYAWRDFNGSNQRLVLKIGTHVYVARELLKAQTKHGLTKLAQGFNSYRAVKKYLGSPGLNKEWHHIVGQAQIIKSGFSSKIINNTNNLIAISKDVHRKISGFYSSKPEFAGGKTVRDWLAGQSYEEQYKYGIDVLKRFGVIK